MIPDLPDCGSQIPNQDQSSGALFKELSFVSWRAVPGSLVALCINSRFERLLIKLETRFQDPQLPKNLEHVKMYNSDASARSTGTLKDQPQRKYMSNLLYRERFTKKTVFNVDEEVDWLQELVRIQGECEESEKWVTRKPRAHERREIYDERG